MQNTTTKIIDFLFQFHLVTITQKNYIFFLPQYNIHLFLYYSKNQICSTYLTHLEYVILEMLFLCESIQFKLRKFYSLHKFSDNFIPE